MINCSNTYSKYNQPINNSFFNTTTDALYLGIVDAVPCTKKSGEEMVCHIISPSSSISPNIITEPNCVIRKMAFATATYVLDISYTDIAPNILISWNLPSYQKNVSIISASSVCEKDHNMDNNGKTQIHCIINEYFPNGSSISYPTTEFEIASSPTATKKIKGTYIFTIQYTYC